MIIKHCLHVWSYIQNVVLHSKCTIPPSPAVSAEPLGLSLSEGEVHVHVMTQKILSSYLLILQISRCVGQQLCRYNACGIICLYLDIGESIIYMLHMAMATLVFCIHKFSLDTSTPLKWVTASENY